MTKKEEKEEKVPEVDTTKVKLYEGRLPMTKKEEKEEKEEKVTEVDTTKVKLYEGRLPMTKKDGSTVIE
jgi:hypothetical protein